MIIKRASCLFQVPLQEVVVVLDCSWVFVAFASGDLDYRESKVVLGVHGIGRGILSAKMIMGSNDHGPFSLNGHRVTCVIGDEVVGVTLNVQWLRIDTIGITT